MTTIIIITPPPPPPEEQPQRATDDFEVIKLPANTQPPQYSDARAAIEAAEAAGMHVRVVDTN